MNPIILNLTDGTLFFVGLVVVALADVLLLRFRGRFVRPVLTLVALVGIVLVVISSTPQPLWAYAMWFVPAVASLVLGNLRRSPRHLRITSTALMFSAALGLAWAEGGYYCSPPRTVVASGQTVYVLGDSLSAGMGAGERCWPVVLAEISGLSVVNLAEPGTSVHSALQQAGRITQPGSVVIVEIGGNDLLGGADAGVFREQLDSLVQALWSGQHEVLMLELPLFPFKNAFGRAQREIAAKYGATMLPKRFVTKVLGIQGGTLDGLHLSQAGHDAMVGLIGGVLEGEGKQKGK